MFYRFYYVGDPHSFNRCKCFNYVGEYMKKKKHALTLMEMMFVIVLIGIIGSVLTYNFRGALNRAKTFKTEEMKKKIDSALDLALLDGYQMEDLEGDKWELIIAQSPLIETPKDGFKDAWGERFIAEVDDQTIRVHTSHTK